jgi:hypothetical protein
MKLKLIILILVHILQNGQAQDHVIPETNITGEDVNSILSFFSRINLATILDSLNMEKLSEKCLNHTQMFQQSLTSPTDGYWQLKSKKICSFRV